MLKLILPGERPMSMNKIYAGSHWILRRNEAQRVHDVVFYELRKLWIGKKIQFPIFTEKVAITITAYFHRNPLDASNISIKLYEDGLKGYVIADDNLHHVDAITAKSRIDRGYPRVEIEIAAATPIADVETQPIVGKAVRNLGTRYSPLPDTFGELQ